MDEIKEILHKGSVADRKYLFSFTISDNSERIYKKFTLFTRYFYPKFFKSKDAPFHKEMVMRMITMYQGQQDEFLNIGFRGCSKTTFTKLFLVFIIANDTQRTRKYIKILSSDLKNSKQIVTDIYNMLVGESIMAHYPELFEKTEQKRQETMDIIDFATGVKVVAGTVGQVQRGNVQGSEEASRPDILVFDDIETRDSLRSAVKSRAIWDSMQEAIDGLAVGGLTIFLANYVSERGNVHRLVERVKNKLIIPIVDDKGEPTWGRYSKDQIEVMKAKADDWEGEYMCRPSASKDVLVSREELEKQLAIEPIKLVAGFKLFKEYNPSHRIGAGHDIALGVGLDSSTSVFIDFSTVPFQVVGTYYNNEIKPDEFGDEIARQGRMFGECLLAPEKNNAGVATIGRLKQIYPFNRIHATRKSQDKITEPTLSELGWDTNSMTKSKMFNDLAEALESGYLALNDENLIREAKSYTRNDLLDREADVRLVTRHFDLLTACAIAYQMKDFAVVSSQKYKDPFELRFNKMLDETNLRDDSFE